MREQITELLGATGSLAQHICGFAPRIQQQQMAVAVNQALLDDAVLIAEAGTGTGKTYAYLVPALLADKKIIISTGTRNLQDQLYQKDLPIVRKALQVPAQIALLKGRANYLCLHRLQLAELEGSRLSRQLRAELQLVKSWAGRSRSGDIAEVTELAEDSSLWPRVTSTIDNCLGAECPEYSDCFFVKARRSALDADILIVNHHLFCADMVVKEEGFGEILPGADAFILDEAHQLPEVASHFFGLSLSSHQLHELARDIQVEQLRDAADFTDLTDLARRLDTANSEFRLALGLEPRRAPWQQVAQQENVQNAVADLNAALAALLPALSEAAIRGKGLDSCHARCTLLTTRLAQLTNTDNHNDVLWFETRQRSFTLNSTPLEVSAIFQSRMEQYHSAWVFTSATLAVAENFTHFASRLGLGLGLGVREPTTLKLESPFDYARNALLYHPKELPDPSSSDYNQAVLAAVLPVLEASRGRAFVLFTSHQALREAADWLTAKLDYPLLVQGSLPKGALLERFRTVGNAVLLGTASFWEGVDVRGDALSCVIIAKLPFASPGDPVLQARITALRSKGGNPFMDYQLPQAVIALKQGVGRLIRDVSDRGVLMLCDPRLLSKPYGRIFLDSLPPMRRTRSLRHVQQFFAPATSTAAPDT